MVCHYGFITSLYSTMGHSYSLYTNHYTSVYITTPKGHLSHQLMPTRCNYNCFGSHQIVLGCKQLIVRWNRMLRYTSKLPYFLSESSGLPQSKISHFTIPYLLPLLRRALNWKLESWIENWNRDFFFSPLSKLERILLNIKLNLPSNLIKTCQWFNSS